MSKWPTFPRKAAIAPDDLMVQGKECLKCVFQANELLNKKQTNLHVTTLLTLFFLPLPRKHPVRFTPYVNCCFSPRAFYLDQSNMPPSSAPKAALIDKVRMNLHNLQAAFMTPQTTLQRGRLCIRNISEQSSEVENREEEAKLVYFSKWH